MKPSTIGLLTPIPEAISNEPSCSNLHDLSIATRDANCLMLEQQQHQQQQQQQQQEPTSWQIYENDEDNSKSTDALLEEQAEEEEEEVSKRYTTNISFAIIKENQQQQQQQAYKLSNSNSNCSMSRMPMDVMEKQQQQPIVVIRSRASSKNASKLYEPISSESLTDSQGYMDDFDESCALITTENDRRRKMSSSNDLIHKRNSLGVAKVPQIHRFSAGDADKLERGIKSSLPSTRSLRDN
jgi:hypothetical protein